MTKPIESKHQRLLAIERQLRALREAIPEALQLKIDNGILIAANRRLLGEIDAYRRNVDALQRYIETLKRRAA